MEQNKSTKVTDNAQDYYRKTIGKTTYLVRVHFSETATENLEEKIKRMLRKEANSQ